MSRLQTRSFDSISWEKRITLGLEAGYENGLKFGRNEEIDTTTDPEDVWDGGGIYTGFPTGAPELVTATSSSTDDVLTTGTGAWTIRIFGLKTSSSTAYESEDIDLDGTNLVDSVNTWYRINRVKVIDAGSGGVNAGNISIAHKTTTANIFAVVPATYNQSQVACLTVPTGVTMLVNSINISLTRLSGAAGSATIVVYVREPNSVFQAQRIYTLATSQTFTDTSRGGWTVPEGSDIKIGVPFVSDNDTSIHALIDYTFIT